MKIIKKIGLYIFVILAIYIMFKMFVFYMPFLLGYIFSEILEPIIRFFMKRFSIKRKTSSIIVIFSFFVIILLLLFLGGTFIVSETTNLLGNFNEYLNEITNFINNLTQYVNIDKLNLNSEIKNIFENAVIDFVNNFANGIKNVLSNFLGIITSLPKIFIYIIITILATYFISSDKFYILDQLEYHFPKKWVNNVRENSKNIFNSLGAYLKAEIIMIFISFIIILTGISIFYFIGLNVKYPLLVAVSIGFVDSLPILRKWNNLTALVNYMFCK